jgi:enterochelin esterase-like enzyme
MMFGVAAVNKYYDYYQTWSAVAADIGSQGVSSAAQIPEGASGQGVNKALSQGNGHQTAAADGQTVRLRLTGRYSHLTRTVYLYLPPEYFQAAYRHYRFPSIELIPGFPGQPQDWINVAGITHTFQTLLHDGVVKPAVLVMPDPNGGPRTSLQCLNVRHGPQDATFLAVDVPKALSRSFRVRWAGPAWGIAGYSEGGFCAANLALTYPGRYGYAGVLSGYFRPFNDRIGNPPRIVPPFGKNKALRLKNTPIVRLQKLPLSVKIPRIWLGAGSADHSDVVIAQQFQRLLLARQPSAPLVVASGGSHNMATWRALIPPLLEWMTPRLANQAAHIAAGHAGAAKPPVTGPTRTASSPPHRHHHKRHTPR